MTPPPQVVDSFSGPYAFLSNFHVRAFILDGVEYRSGEHAFNALKTLNPDEAARVRDAATPGLAKRFGRRVTLRAGWDERVRYEVMRSVLAAKFADPHMRDLLLDTADALLIEGNHWHDLTWGGHCTCAKHRGVVGHNHLGRALMALRSQLRGDAPERWVRAAVMLEQPLDEWARTELSRVLRKLATAHATTTVLTSSPAVVDVAQRAGQRVSQYPADDSNARAIRDADVLVHLAGERPAAAGSKPVIYVDTATHSTHRLA